MTVSRATVVRGGRQGFTRRRFTLIEILVVIGIVLVLSALLIMGLMGSKTKAQIKGTKGFIQKIKTALQMYHADFRDYPPDGYDTEPPPPGGTGWNYTTVGGFDGVQVGTPPRCVKGTAALLYFLCRPLKKITTLGADPGDPRNIQIKIVGPYMTITDEEVTRAGFDPSHLWSDNAYWTTQKFIVTELKDKFNRPLLYDKVKSVTPAGVYFQPDRFHVSGGSATSLPRGAGRYVHPDQDFLNNSVALLADDEAACPEGTHDGGYAAVAGMSQTAMMDIHTDPRMKQTFPQSDGCPVNNLTGGFPVGSTASHEPKALGGGYDLWSYGVSWMNCRDDISSWKD